MKIVFASNNQGKIREIKALFANVAFEVIPQQQLGVAEIPETGLTFVENAIIKARHAARSTNLPALADDSGLVVPFLNGEPGIYSARYAGQGASSLENNKKLLAKLTNSSKQERRACFYAVLVYLRHENDPMPIISQASWHGVITDEFIGDAGFGYDPVFYLPELHKTAAQLSTEEKNAISHRGKALQELLQKLSYPL